MPAALVDTGFLETLSSDRHEQMVSILALSQTMLDLARAEDWDALPQQESLRRTLIAKFFAEKPDVNTAAVIEQAIRKLLVMDKEILALGVQAKNAVGEQINQLSTGHKVSKAYLQNSR